ncbi:hypothetical protein V6N12_068713 [Hibiscus sabdariffa]|uniref:Uncharacterized protein n=1 Tax=Hibiscus sabdariffa TaxID=183260 RepID=A0ABR2FQU4_9ROSI
MGFSAIWPSIWAVRTLITTFSSQANGGCMMILILILYGDGPKFFGVATMVFYVLVSDSDLIQDSFLYEAIVFNDCFVGLSPRHYRLQVIYFKLMLWLITDNWLVPSNFLQVVTNHIIWEVGSFSSWDSLLYSDILPISNLYLHYSLLLNFSAFAASLRQFSMAANLNSLLENMHFTKEEQIAIVDSESVEDVSL